MKTSHVVIVVAALAGVICLGTYLYMEQTPVYERTFQRGLPGVRFDSTNDGSTTERRPADDALPAASGSPR